MDDLLRSYEASGLLRYPDDTALECDAKLTHDHNGALGLQYAGLRRGRSPSPQSFGEMFGLPSPIRFDGHTVDGLPLTVNGTFHRMGGRWSVNEGTSAAFEVLGRKDNPATLEVGTRPDHTDGEWRFGLTNFLFEAPSGTAYPDGSADRGVMTHQLGSHAVRLERRAEYSEAEKDLRGRSKIRVTAEVCIPASITFIDAQDIATDLCALLSIAHGTLINWVYCDRPTVAHGNYYSFHRDGTTRPYNGGLPLIGPVVEADLPEFLEATFEPFTRKKEDWRLRGFSHAYADIRTTGFLEARCLQAGCLIDFLTGKDAAIAHDATVIDEDEFNAKRGRLCSALQRILLLAFPTLTQGAANAMAQNARYWHYRTFEQKIARTSRRLRIILRRDEAKAVVQTRNDLVHRMEFHEEGQEWEELARTLVVLDQLLMGLLEYRGAYVNPLTLRRVNRATPAAIS